MDRYYRSDRFERSDRYTLVEKTLVMFLALTAMRKHFNIKISGKVQGVFFRASAKETADTLNIAGFAKNEPDGTVYIEAEGEPGHLKQFINWCHHGPETARVNRCDVNEAPQMGYHNFIIHR